MRACYVAKLLASKQSTSSRRLRPHSSSEIVFEPVEVSHRGIVEENVDRAKGVHGKIDHRLTVDVAIRV